MEDAGIEVVEQESASRKLGADTARELIAAAKKVHVAKGKKLEVFEGGMPNDEIVAKLLGSTGNLRAPAIVAGDQLLVGFNEESYREVLG